MPPLYDAQVLTQPTPSWIELHGSASDIEPRLSRWGFEPLRTGCSHRLGPRSLLRVSPVLWVLLGPPGQGAADLGDLAREPVADDTLIVDLSEGWAHLAVTGPQAPELMSAATSLDLHPRQFPAEAATFTEVFGLRTLLRRRLDGFDLAVERSHAAYVADWFARLQGQRAAPSSLLDPGKPGGSA